MDLTSSTLSHLDDTYSSEIEQFLQVLTLELNFCCAY